MIGRQSGCVLRRLSACVLLGVCPAFGNTIYVDIDATGNNNGQSWTHAYTDLQDALGDCSSGDEIWVADGTYTPDDCSPSCDRSVSFDLVDGCDVLGGFVGTETSSSQRDSDANVTILSGDNSGNDPTVTDNAYNVLWSETDVGATTLIDGFTVTAGHSNSHYGGGFFKGDPELGHLWFHGNYAASTAGGLGTWGGAYIHHCRFTYNTNATGGLGAGALLGGGPTMRDCLFANNGGGIAGGAIFVGTDATPTIENCTIADNYLGFAPVGGAGIYINNNAGASTITNVILWGNTGGSQISGDLSSLTITYTDIQGCSSLCNDPDDHNIDSNPQFGSGHCGSYHITDDSPCYDAGDASCPVSGNDLCDGHLRCTGTYVDMGAYEVECVDDDDCVGDPAERCCKTSTNRCVECVTSADCWAPRGCIAT
jgi:hypothetical protein